MTPEETARQRIDAVRIASGGFDFVLANGSMSSNQSREGEIRKPIVKADFVDFMVAFFAIRPVRSPHDRIEKWFQQRKEQQK